MRLFLSTIRKLLRRPATWITFGVMSVLLTLILLAVATAGNLPDNDNGPDFDPRILVTFPGAYVLILGFVLNLGGLFALVFGAAIAGSEWTWGTFKSSVARGESRVVYMLATFAACVVVIAVGLLATYAIGIVAGALGALQAGVSLDGMSNPSALGDLPELIGRGGAGIVTLAGLGFAMATVARSQLAGIGFGIAAYFVGSFATIFLPEYVKYLPFQLASSALDIGGGFGAGGAGAAASVEPNLALLLLGVWLVGSLAVALGFSERAEVLG